MCLSVGLNADYMILKLGVCLTFYVDTIPEIVFTTITIGAIILGTMPTYNFGLFVAFMHYVAPNP